MSALIFTAGFAPAQEPAEAHDGHLLTLERLFSTEDFEAEEEPEIEWLDDGGGYTILEASTEVELAQDLVAYDAATGERKVIVPASLLVSTDETTPLEIEGYELSQEGTKMLVFADAQQVWRKKTRGDYWLVDLATSERRQIGEHTEPASLMFAKLSPNGEAVAYVRDNDIYVEDLASGKTRRLTNDGSATIINGTFDWVYEEEFGLRDGFRWSPDSLRIAYWQLDASPVRHFSIIDNTSSVYPEVTRIPYPKVGEHNSLAKIGVVDVGSGERIWLDVRGDPRKGYIPGMMWAAGSEKILVQRLNRLQNTNKVSICSASSGACRTILIEADDAWVDIPDDEDPVFLAGGESFTWLSERDGWRHLYLVRADGSEARLLTPGDFDVISLVAVDETAGRAYFIASPEDAGARFLYSAPLDGSGQVQRITPEDAVGTHAYEIAPNAGFAVHTWSRMIRPPATDLVTLPDHRSVRSLEDNRELRESIEALDIAGYELFTVDIGSGVVLDGWCLKPPDFDAARKYPVLFHVYGEPAGQTVRDRWRKKRALWHAMLAQRGYVIISVDNRGTPAPRGRDWRKVVYRQVGILASEEQAAAVRALVERWPWIDRERLGVWGWSGGGSMTLNLMFRYPGLFRVGMSVAPVANQLLYDTIYQERYMGLPDDNEEGYRLGSPITFAHQLEGELLLVHGTADDNVHYQNTELLVNELVEHNKHFTLMTYPNRTHSIKKGENTSRHLHELMTRFLDDKLRSASTTGRGAPTR